VEIAGGEPIFALRHAALAKDRIVHPDVVRDAAPEVILASWCGKKVQTSKIAARPGWREAVPAVRDGHIYEVKSTYILQPGPASLTEGIRQIHARLSEVVGITKTDF
jgi:iron complex transport system substrate-binding protein